jgi:hypothetical protein
LVATCFHSHSTTSTIDSTKYPGDLTQRSLPYAVNWATLHITYFVQQALAPQTTTRPESLAMRARMHRLNKEIDNHTKVAAELALLVSKRSSGG